MGGHPGLSLLHSYPPGVVRLHPDQNSSLNVRRHVRHLIEHAMLAKYDLIKRIIALISHVRLRAGERVIRQVYLE